MSLSISLVASLTSLAHLNLFCKKLPKKRLWRMVLAMDWKQWQLFGGTFSEGNDFHQSTKPVFPHFKVLWGGPCVFPVTHVISKYIFLRGKVRDINNMCYIPVDRERLFLAHPWFNMLFFEEYSAHYFTRWQTFFPVRHMGRSLLPWRQSSDCGMCSLDEIVQ